VKIRARVALMEAIRMWDVVFENFLLTCKIVLMVFVLLVIIEYLEMKYENRLRDLLQGRPLRQCVIASLLGAVPGCMDAFLIVSLYIHGFVGFGALVAVMLSTAGDEAFIMLAIAPEAAGKIFGITIILGIIGGLLADKIVNYLKIRTCENCEIEIHEEKTSSHFLREHVYEHIIKEHLPKLFLWIFIPLTLIELLIKNFDFAPLISELPIWVLIILAALVGILPESGPHMIFLLLYSKGLVPFSVLLVSTLSQDGHGLLPLLSHTVKDTVYVQIFTTVFSIIVGILLYYFRI